MNRLLSCFRAVFLPFCAFMGLSALPFIAHAQGVAPPADLVTVQMPASVALKAGASSKVSVGLTVKTGYHIQANPAATEYFIPTELKMPSSGGVQVGKVVYPPPTIYKTKLSDEPLKVYEGKVSLGVPLTLAVGTKPGIVKLSGTLRYQACNDTSCLPPKNIPVVLTVAVGPATTGKTTTTQQPGTHSLTVDKTSTADTAGDATRIQQQFKVTFLPDVVFLSANGQERTDLRLGQGTAESLTREEMKQRLVALKSGTPYEAKAGGGLLQRFQHASLPLQLILAFIGGLLLNLTPCVYPMIPITVGYFGAQSEGRLGRTLSLGVLYVLGLSMVYSVLGVVAALTGSLFGSALQSRWIIGLVALVLALLGLSMAGLFTIQPPMWLMSRGGAKKGALGALGMGAMLGVVAAPCVGPFVAALLGYVGLKGDALLGFALFFALSVGLGLPYLLLGAFSGSIKALPRSGKWLEKSKKIFALPLLLAAAYYGYLALKPAAATPLNGAWQPATLAAMQEAHVQGKPVVIDFRADWCLPCRKLESDVFSRPDVLQASVGVKLLRADLTTTGS